MKKYTVIDKNTKEVINLIVWDGITPYNPGEIYEVVPMTDEHEKEYNIKIKLHNEMLLKQKADEIKQLLEVE